MDDLARIIRNSFIKDDKLLPSHLETCSSIVLECKYGEYKIPVYTLCDEDGYEIDTTSIEELNKYDIDVKELLGKVIHNINIEILNRSNLLTQLRQIDNGAYNDREFCRDNEWHGELIPTGYTAGFWLEKDKTLSPVIRKLAFEVT